MVGTGPALPESPCQTCPVLIEDLHVPTLVPMVLRTSYIDAWWL